MSDRVTKTWLASEWRFVISVVTPILAIASTWFLLRSDVSLIQYRVDKIENNHLAHIQTALDKLSDQMNTISMQHATLTERLNDGFIKK